MPSRFALSDDGFVVVPSSEAHIQETGRDTLTKICILSSVHLALDNRVFYREAQSLRQAGYDVTLIAVHGQDEVRAGIRILALPRVRRWQRPVLWAALLRRAIETRADVFHFHDPELLIITPWLRWLTGRPTIYDVHEVYTDFIEVKEYIPAWLRPPMAWVFRWLSIMPVTIRRGRGALRCTTARP